MNPNPDIVIVPPVVVVPQVGATPHPTTPAPTVPLLIITPQPTTAAPTTPYPTTPAPVPPLPGHVYGAYMQNCPEGTGNEQCIVTSAIVTDQTGNNLAGQVTCDAAHDCCMCSGIHCGEIGGNSCTSLTLSGEKAAYGVKDINVVVDPATGNAATVTCSGIHNHNDTN